ncbi:MAG: hypothetical protein K2G88_06865 [Oscillospiraceae bacterium]|nr:hypothetical protein [Oscillospiraceae bacterium]
MILKAIGKYIDTLPLKNLISQEESHMDLVIIEVDKNYKTLDLSEFQFVMRGITESGAVTEVILEKKILNTVIRLLWKVERLFTVESGKLVLDLVAYYYNPETDCTQNLPDYVLRYQLPPIEIHGLPDSNHVQELPEESVTNKIQLWESLTQLQENTTTQANQITTINYQIQELENRIKIIVLTQSEYDSIKNPQNQILYIIKN